MSVNSTGAIAWTFNGLALSIDYGVPAGNKLTARTGHDAYAGSASKFWTDIRDQGKKLRKTARIIRIAHPDLVEDIVANSVNSPDSNSATPTDWIERTRGKASRTSISRRKKSTGRCKVAASTGLNEPKRKGL